MKNNIIATLGGLAIISVISTLSLSSAFATNTNTSQDNVTVSVPVSCTMNGTGMTSHNANIPNGTYQADIGTTTLKTFCNDNQGFAIYAIGYTNEEYGNTTLIGATGGQTIVTGTATTTGSPDVSNWAVKLATDSTATYPITLDNSFGAYSSVPSTYTKVAHRDSGTDLGSSATGASLTTTYAAYISKTQQADTYNGKVKYTLVHPSDADAPVPVIACTTPVPNLTYMQDLNSSNKSSVLSSMIEDEQYFLKDKRDEKTYCVAKLRDGNIWMTQNLDHDIVIDGTVVYDNTTTDIGWNSSTSSYDAASWIPNVATLSTNNTSWANGTYLRLDSYDPGELYWNGMTTSEWQDSQLASIGSPHFHIGNYYNWTAAAALNSSDGYSFTNIDQSICPVGWTMPKHGVSVGSLRYLITQYTNWDSSTYQLEKPDLWNTPMKFALSGRWQGQFVSVGLESYYWIPFIHGRYGVDSDGIMYNGEYYGGRDGESFYGYSVRCVSR